MSALPPILLDNVSSPTTNQLLHVIYTNMHLAFSTVSETFIKMVKVRNLCLEGAEGMGWRVYTDTETSIFLNG